MVKHKSTSIPRDIITSEILPRLPIKTLTRFKAICKEWQSSILDPHFIKLHHTYSHVHQKVAFDYEINTSRESFRSLCVDVTPSDLEKSRKVDTITIPRCDYFPVEAPHGVKLLGSSNGLLCVAVNGTNRNIPLHLVLWNPSTRDHKILPNPPEEFLIYGCRHDQLYGFNNNEKAIFSFSYDSPHNDYQLFWLRTFGERYKRCMYYSLKSNIWKGIYNDDIPEYMYFVHEQNIVINGTIFWVANRLGKIIAFDFAKEKFEVVPLPCYLRHAGGVYLVALFDESRLGCLCWYQDQSDARVDLWMMETSSDGTNSVANLWVKLILHNNIDPSVAKIGDKYPVIISTKDGEFLIENFSSAKGRHSHMLCCTTVNRPPIRYHGRFQLLRLPHVLNSFVPRFYCESFVSPNTLYVGHGSS